MKIKKYLLLSLCLIIIAVTFCSCGTTTEYDGKYYIDTMNGYSMDIILGYFKESKDEEIRKLGELDTNKMYIELNNGTFTMTSIKGEPSSGKVKFDGNKVKFIITVDDKDEESPYYPIENNTITMSDDNYVITYKKR